MSTITRTAKGSDLKRAFRAATQHLGEISQRDADKIGDLFFRMATEAMTNQGKKGEPRSIKACSSMESAFALVAEQAYLYAAAKRVTQEATR